MSYIYEKAEIQAMMGRKSHLTSGVISLLPLFYVGWSDSVLSPSEMKLIHSKIEDLEHLTNDDKRYLIKWTDPLNPPDPEIFKYWASEISYFSEELNVVEKRNLIELGIAMGNSISKSENSAEFSLEVRGALTDIATSLGVDYVNGAVGFEGQFGLSDTMQFDSCSGNFNCNKMLVFLDGEHVELKSRIRKLLCDPIFHPKHIADKEEYRALTLERTKLLANQGMSAYSFPTKYGGKNSRADHMVVFEMISYSDLSLTIKFGVQFGLFGGALYMLGTKKHHDKYLKDMYQAKLLGCFAMTETGHGSNVKGLETTATYDHINKELIIHSPSVAAGKEYIGNAIHSEMAAVFAQLIVNGENQGVHSILVPLRDKRGNVLTGVKVEDCGYKLGLNGVDNGRIWFDSVRVPVFNLLDKYGSISEDGSYESPISSKSKRFFTMLGALVVGRICVGLSGVVCSLKALAITIRYATKRRQFETKAGEPEQLILDYPTHQKRLFPKLAKTYAYYFAIKDLANKYAHADESDVRKIETLAAGLKSKATWHATATIQECREACGGKGYLAENQLADLKADSDIYTTFEGDNTVLMQLVAKGLLTQFNQNFHDDGSMAVVKFLMKKVKLKLKQYNAFEKRSTDHKHILSPNFHEEALEYRYRKTLITLTERMRKFLGRKMDPHQAFLRTQTHMVALADAYIDLIVFRSFRNKIQSCQEAELVPVLTKLCQLYALETIYNNGRWYLENEFLEGVKTKAIRRNIHKLNREIRPNALALVDSFGIPDELIGAPIAL